MPSNSALYQFVSNNTVSSAQAHLQERLKELNANSDLLLNPRRRVHLSEEVAKEFKTSLPREQKLFHFSPGKPTTTFSIAQQNPNSNFKAPQHLSANGFSENSPSQTRDSTVSAKAFSWARQQPN